MRSVTKFKLYLIPDNLAIKLQINLLSFFVMDYFFVVMLWIVLLIMNEKDSVFQMTVCHIVLVQCVHKKPNCICSVFRCRNTLKNVVTWSYINMGTRLVLYNQVCYMYKIVYALQLIHSSVYISKYSVICTVKEILTHHLSISVWLWPGN